MSSPSGPTPANWYPDPTGRHQLRYFDGAGWTAHVSSNGNQSTDPIDPGPVPSATQSVEKTQRQLERAGVVAGSVQGGGTIFSEPVLVVNQKAKLIEINNEYSICDQHGRQIAAIRQVGQTALKKAVRVLTSLDQFLTHRLQIVDMNGAVLLTVTRPAKLLKSTFSIGDAHGNVIGEIFQKNAIGKIRFGLVSGGREVGSLNAENWRAWNFAVLDASGVEVARITKTWEGLARTVFTTADNYVVQVHRPLEDPLRSLVVASALSVDTALKQDSRGLG
jgi:uncharacterized protein YxjI